MHLGNIKKAIHDAYKSDGGGTVSIGDHIPGSGTVDTGLKCRNNIERGHIQSAVDAQSRPVAYWLKFAYAPDEYRAKYYNAVILDVWKAFLDSGVKPTKKNGKQVGRLIKLVVLDYRVKCISSGERKQFKAKEIIQALGADPTNYHKSFKRYVEAFEGIMAGYDLEGLENVKKTIQRLRGRNDG
jgi:hypothetical protein